MVNVRRIDPHLHREFSFREGRVRRREIIRQRFMRDRPPVIRRLFIDRDEISDDIIRDFNNREEVPYELAFAPLSPEVNPEILPPALVETESEEEEEDTESTSGYTDDLSDCSTINIDWEDLESNRQLSLGLLRAWEANAEIRPSVDVRIQTSSPFTPPGSPPAYSSPDYSPVRLEDLEELETENNEPFYSESEGEDLIADAQVNRILDFLESEDFSDITLQ